MRARVRMLQCVSWRYRRNTHYNNHTATCILQQPHCNMRTATTTLQHVQLRVCVAVCVSKRMFVLSQTAAVIRKGVQMQKYNGLQHTATHCNTMYHTATHCNALQRTATHCYTLLHTATHCNTLQRTATHCNTLQHTATVVTKNLTYTWVRTYTQKTQLCEC